MKQRCECSVPVFPSPDRPADEKVTWEHLVMAITTIPSSTKTALQLDECGKMGWELVTVNDGYAYFKKRQDMDAQWRKKIQALQERK